MKEPSLQIIGIDDGEESQARGMGHILNRIKKEDPN